MTSFFVSDIITENTTFRHRKREACLIKRTTIKDIAASLGVSLSTVNKALYGKPGVGEQRRAEVLDAAEKLGYQPNRAALSLARARIRIGVVIPSNWPAYFEPIRCGIERALAELQDFFVSGDIRYYDAEAADAQAAVAQLFCALHSNCDAVIFCPSERHSYYESLTWADAQGFPVAVVGDARPDAPCLFTVETAADACAALAANLLMLTTPPQSLLAVAGGFADLAPHIEKAAVFERVSERPVLRVFTQDNETFAYEKMREALREHPDLAGVYIATSAGEGICRAVADSGLPVRVAATDLSPVLRGHLLDGTVQGIIYQNTYLQGALAVLTLADYLTFRVLPAPLRRVEPRLFLRENCPESFEDAADDLVLRG